MKKAVVVLFAVLMAGSAFALNKGETEIEVDGWFRYVLGTTAFDFANLTRSDFLLDRGYIRLSHNWTTNLFSKVTVDVLSSSAYSDGASIRLKEAYVDYNLPLKETKFTAGLQKNYFSLIYSWDYTNLEKSLGDKEGVLASADYGLSLNGYLPGGFGEWQLGAYNGEGYKKVFATGGAVNTVPQYVVNLRLTPLAGVQLGASALMNASDRSAFKNGTANYWKSKETQVALPDTANINRLGLAPMAKLAFGPVSLLGEYIDFGYTRQYHYYACDTLGVVTDSTKKASEKKYHQSGFSVVPVVSLFKRKLELVGRYDLWNVQSEAADKAMALDSAKSHSVIGAGFNWHFARREKGRPGVELQLMWQREQAMNKAAKPKDQFSAQFRWEWTHLLLPL
jgi:hypothetical protein